LAHLAGRAAALLVGRLDFQENTMIVVNGIRWDSHEQRQAALEEDRLSCIVREALSATHMETFMEDGESKIKLTWPQLQAFVKAAEAAAAKKENWAFGTRENVFEAYRKPMPE
jgi:hypothetical protein